VRVYNGVDIERWERPPSLDPDCTLDALGLKNQPFALYVGGYHWHKNVDGMLGGVARARARGAKMLLVWPGNSRRLTGTSSKTQLNDLAQPTRFGSLVTFRTNKSRFFIVQRWRIRCFRTSRVWAHGDRVDGQWLPRGDDASGSLAEIAGTQR